MSEHKPHVLVIDDDQHLCELLSLRLGAQGYRVSLIHTAGESLALVRRDRPDAVVLDLRLGHDDGLDVLVALLDYAPELQVLVLTAHGSIEMAVEAMRRGAIGFMTKPFRDRELLDHLAQAIERSALQRSMADTSSNAPRNDGDPAARLIGRSAAMAEVRGLVERVGPTDATVLISGESGTGKELVARALHQLSSRAKGPFVPLNCGALPPELLTSELFGHTKGAFTGATHDREGVFGAARGGTLFLDEIGEAPLDVQVRLLRVLQEQRYTPVGSSTEKPSDVRVVAATNRDLFAEVQAKRFREDLYFRLRVVPLHLPPLRQRADDIPLLAELFLGRAAARHGRPAPRLTEAAVAALAAHPLPGNVRQLIHVLEAALLLAPGAVIDDALVGRLLTPDGSAPVETIAPRASVDAADNTAPASLASLFDGGELPPFSQVRKEVERLYLIEVLRRARGNVTAAAKMAGRHRGDFYELLRRHNLTGNAFRSG